MLVCHPSKSSSIPRNPSGGFFFHTLIAEQPARVPREFEKWNPRLHVGLVSRLIRLDFPQDSSLLGLGYSDLYYTTAFNGGGLYTVTLTNFVVGANSLKGLFFVGDANDTAGPLIFTATGGAVSSWTQAGNQFAIGFDTATYTFTPATGKLQPNGNDPDGGGIVLDLGSLSSYTQIKLSFGASTADGWRYGVGEVSSTSSATPEPATFGLLGLSLVGVGIKLYRKRN